MQIFSKRKPQPVYCGIGSSFTLHLIMMNFHHIDENKIISFNAIGTSSLFPSLGKCPIKNHHHHPSPSPSWMVRGILNFSPGSRHIFRFNYPVFLQPPPKVAEWRTSPLNTLKNGPFEWKRVGFGGPPVTQLHGSTRGTLSSGKQREEKTE